MRVYKIIRRRIKGRAIVYQGQQRKVFYILFTIFIIIYTIILVFIEASLKFIRAIAIEPAKGILGILGQFYNNSRSIKKGEGNK